MPSSKLERELLLRSQKNVLSGTDILCIHALGSLLSTVVALNRELTLGSWAWRKKKGNVGYVQCLDHDALYTHSWTVTFEIKRAIG